MKHIVSLSINLLLISFSGCNQKTKPTETPTNDGIPKCLQQMIDDQKKENPASLPLEITEYEFNGKNVFLLSPDCCDQFEMLYSADCQVICAPSGGIQGSGDGKCPDFQKDAKKIKVVWKKE